MLVQPKTALKCYRVIREAKEQLLHSPDTHSETICNGDMLKLENLIGTGWPRCPEWVGLVV